MCTVSAQEIKDNLYPKAGDICKDRGDLWRNITLGPCEAGTTCTAVKRGVYKCVPNDPALGAMPLGALCYNRTQVDQKDRKEGEKWRQYYRVRNCVFQGVDKQGTPLVQCVQTASDANIYRCKKVPVLGTKGCFTVAGSMIWGRWNDDQAYDACDGCPCSPAGKKCIGGTCKYPACKCNQVCDATRRANRCATT